MMTVKEYMTQTPEGCFELIDGVLREPPAPDYEHQSSSHSLDMKLSNFVERNSLGIVLTAPVDVVLDQNLAVQPDILFISNKNKHIITKQNIQGAPDLVIEIVSPSSIHHDTVRKKKIYEKYGIHEYWIIYPEEKVIEVFILQKNHYILHQTAQENDTVKSVLLKGFTVATSKIFNSLRF